MIKLPIRQSHIVGTIVLFFAWGESLSLAQDLSTATKGEVTVLFDVGHHEIGMDDVEALRRRLASRKADDGFRYHPVNELLTPSVLDQGQIIVFRVPLGSEQVDNWSSSTRPSSSAFTQDEIQALVDWVNGGGGLLVVADHMPMAGAVQELLAAFDVNVLDGFVVEEDQLSPSGTLENIDSDGWITFRRRTGGLAEHPITEGHPNTERIEFITTDVGSAFDVPAHFSSLLTLGAGAVSLMPDTAWALSAETKRIDVEGWSQAAVSCVGRGRLAILADAWPYMTGPYFDNEAQASVARYHPQFTSNLMSWLAGRIRCK